MLDHPDRNTPKEIVLSGDLNLLPPEHGDAALTLAGPQVTIQAKPGTRPTIRFTNNANPQYAPWWAGVSIESPKVKVSGVRFIVNGGGGDVRMAALRLHGPENAAFVVDNCEFIQANPGVGKRLASLDAASDGARAALNLTGSRFLSFMGIDNNLLDNSHGFGGHDAVLREGPVEIHAVNCAFGPHGAAFRLEGARDGAAAPPLTLDHCSLLASGPSAVFDVRPGAAASRLSIRDLPVLPPPPGRPAPPS